MNSEIQILPRFEIRPLSADEGGGYLVEFPDFPGCIADGETPEDAVREGRDAIASYVKTLKELGRDIPVSAKHIVDSGGNGSRNLSMHRLPDAPTTKGYH